MKTLSRLFALVTLASISTGCDRASFFSTLPENSTTSSTETSKKGSANNPPPICGDVIGGGTTSTAQNGLKGKIYYERANLASHITQVKNYASLGNLSSGATVAIPNPFYISQMFIPDRIFDTGFADSNSTPVKMADGTTLVEFFSLHMESNLVLGTAPAGNYQLALLSDDGSVLDIKQNGNWSTLVDSDGDHTSQVKCSATTVTFNSSTSLPIRYYYYQGPRAHISSILMWKKIDASHPIEQNGVTFVYNQSGTTMGAKDCGFYHDPNFFFNNYNGTSPVMNSAKQPFVDMIARGWKVIEPQNFVLNTGDTNACVN